VAEHRNGRDVIAVLLGSASIWTDMATLLDDAFAAEATLLARQR